MHERTVFDVAIRLGMTVGEVEPQGKAALETHLLWRWVANQLNLKIGES
ncbi:MAG: ATPase, partial [Proteobacteria bacterium]